MLNTQRGGAGHTATGGMVNTNMADSVRFSETLSDGGPPQPSDILMRAWPNPTFKPDIFQTGPVAAPPWITENTYAHSSPAEWEGRVASKTVVHTGGGTDTAVITHHTVTRPKLPPGSITTATFTLSQYLPKEDVAVQELHEVVDLVLPFLPAMRETLGNYMLHCPEDAWITSTGFVSCCTKAGIKMSRAQYLTLERSVPKDTMGRVNVDHIFQVVEAVSNMDATGTLLSTVPECLPGTQLTSGTTRLRQADHNNTLHLTNQQFSTQFLKTQGI